MKKLFRDPNVWIAIVLAAIVIPSLIYAIVKHVRREPEDNGFMTCCQGKTLVPRFVPDNSPIWSVIADNTIDEEVLSYAVGAWNEKVNKVVLRSRVSHEWFRDPNYDLSSEYKFATVSITLATEPTHDESGGVTHNNYDKSTGEVYWSEITINPFYTHDKAHYKAAMLHELGHALLLAHDDHPTSIMRKELNVRGTITDHDAEIVRELWTKTLQERP